MSHTPAPWLYARVNDTTEAIVTDDGDSVCDVRGASPADLRLISAAPDLLAALRHLMDFSEGLRGSAIHNRARAAIARATYTPEA